MVNTPEDNQQDSSAPFNSAIATLMRLDQILRDIKNLILDNKLSGSVKQARKYYLVKAFYIQAFPLIKLEEDKERVKAFIETMKPEYAKKYCGGKVVENIIFSHLFDDKLDEALMMIQESLQVSGIFMPERTYEGL